MNGKKRSKTSSLNGVSGFKKMTSIRRVKGHEILSYVGQHQPTAGGHKPTKNLLRLLASPIFFLTVFHLFFCPSSLVHFGGFLLFYSVYAVVKRLLLLPVFKISQNMEQNLATVLWPKQQTTINPRLTKTSRNICQRNRPGAKKHVKRALR